ncbi:MAG: phosphate-starvation-inducible PsiE family protein [Parachlamydiaceae bacterium]|nr:phosphate-starvation-inducible PsiE family protein [Parachlamydiaceae bacterium]
MKDHETEADSIPKSHDPSIKFMLKVVAWNVKFLAFLMVLVIIWASADVLYHLIWEVFNSPTNFFSMDDLIGILGSFLAVLIAIEIFLNIVFYLKEDEIHVPLVIATALTAISRKIIIFDYTKIAPLMLLSIAAVIFALGVTYWLVTVKPCTKK